MSQTTNDLLNQYIEAVKKIYGPHLKQIILYGSYARGDFHEHSDIDILILVDLSDSEAMLFSDDLSELGFEYNISYNVWIMPIVKNTEHFRHWCSAYPFYANILEEGISLYEAA